LILILKRKRDFNKSTLSFDFGVTLPVNKIFGRQRKQSLVPLCDCSRNLENFLEFEAGDPVVFGHFVAIELFERVDGVTRDFGHNLARIVKLTSVDH